MALNIQAAMAGLGSALTAIDGIQVYDHPSDLIVVPAAVVALPDSITYDSTMGRGMDEAEIPVLIILSQIGMQTSVSELSLYLGGAGDRSVKAAIEADPTLGGSVNSVRVTSGDVDILPWNDVEYLAAIFNVEIIG